MQPLQLNFRVQSVRDIVRSLPIHSVLDVGCRDCQARLIFDEDVNYAGADLFQNPQGSVTYVGDVTQLNFGRQFDCVMALDMLEHVDDPHELIDKLTAISSKFLIVSLPNIYDLLHKWLFLTKNSLGGKYYFRTENSLDRHRWVMNCDEIRAFYQSHAARHGMELSIVPVRFGAYAKSLRARILSPLLSTFLGRDHLTHTLVGVFEKK